MSGILDLGPAGTLGLRGSWPPWVLAALIVVAVVVTVVVYRRQGGISSWLRVVLTMLRATACVLLIALVFEPVLSVAKDLIVPSNVLVLLDVSQSMTLTEQRSKEEDLLDAARALGSVPLSSDAGSGGTAASIDAATTDAREKAARATRLDMARGLIANPALEVFRRQNDEVRTHFFRFGASLEPAEIDATFLDHDVVPEAATAGETRLGSALEEAIERYSGQTIDAVVVLTDGASNAGADPLEVARRLGAKGVPVYPLGLGLMSPEDVRIRAVVVQDTVFVKDRVPVKVEIVSSGYDGRAAELTVTLDGAEVARRSVLLGSDSRFEELSFVPQGASGARQLDVKLTPLEGESTVDNNSVSRTLRVVDEKIKVLYVEGRPRWEYRYLRAVLTRDPRLDVKFLLTEGDPELPKVAPGYIGRFPERAEDTAKYDLVILGDVPAHYFTRAQLEWVEKHVRENGGSFLLLAGHEFAPMSYRDTPITSVLPVELAAGTYRDVTSSVHPVPTAQGLESRMVLLGGSRRQSSSLWRLVHPLYRLPVLRGAKPGAKVLMTTSDSNAIGGRRRDGPYPLVAWHRYGTGKSLFVGTDQLWRLRYRQGDRHHAGFWGQAIRFLTLSRLLGQNKRIRIETDRTEYRTAERVNIYVNALDESFDPLTAPTYSVHVSAEHLPNSVRLELQAVPGTPGLYQGTYSPEREGQYEIAVAAADRGSANAITLGVTPFDREKLEPDMQRERLERVAEASGGEYLEITDLPGLAARLEPHPRTVEVRHERELWDHWALFVVFLVCAGLEWFLRRRYDLA